MANGQRRWLRRPVLGRDAEVAETTRLLNSWPAVALVGPGGIGKSTIAASVLEQQMPTVRVGRIDVSQVADPTDENIVRAIATELGVNEETHTDLATSILDSAAADGALVVLGNAVFGRYAGRGAAMRLAELHRSLTAS